MGIKILLYFILMQCKFMFNLFLLFVMDIKILLYFILMICKFMFDLFILFVLSLNNPISLYDLVDK